MMELNKQLNVRVDTQTKVLLGRLAQIEGRSASKVVRLAIRDRARRLGIKPAKASTQSQEAVNVQLAAA